MTIIECQDLTKEYLGGETPVKAVDHVSLRFERGEFAAITGPSTTTSFPYSGAGASALSFRHTTLSTN